MQFDTAAAWLAWDEVPAVRRIARCLAADHGLQVTVEGYADERGPSSLNRELARRRAARVADQLWVQGVARDRIRVVTRGEQDPVCSDATATCWAKNRRALLTTSRE